ncbi:MAG: hypothetical protein H7Z12_16580 [Rhodospirillaceae bacterium]|nr:hypothetical protein [Rhodospirillales bacterium]
MSPSAVADEADPQWRHALLVFSGQSDLWWLRLLKPGFRHCFVALSGSGGWVVVDPLSHRTCVAHIPFGPEYDLAGWYRAHGLTVVKAKVFSPSKRVAPVRAYSCVESVKRILGIHAGWVLTPWQLFRYVNKSRKYLLTEESG